MVTDDGREAALGFFSNDHIKVAAKCAPTYSPGSTLQVV